ncbi:MAG: PD40 domain-containing protein [Bacteroidales bacterium]|nr:PD40 domain-containing protein [Bacteroidales bacterium]
MKHFFVIFSLLILSSCSVRVEGTVEKDCPPDLWPDYNGVTIPKNIAPLNFSTSSFDSLDRIEAVLKTFDGENYNFSGKNYIDFPLSDWRKILEKSSGKKMEISVTEFKNDKKYVYKPFEIFVADSEIDSFLCYRLIAPGYQIYSRMGIYCRNLTDFQQNTVVDNRLINANCVNCHSFCKGNTDFASFHVRGNLNSTVLKNGNEITVCKAVTDKFKLNCVYPYWHPQGKYIAYSQNNTAQAFHCGDANRVEVYDMESRVVVYDIANNKLLTSPELNSEKTFTSEPSFSPDGKYLYFISADSVNMSKHTKEVRYDICRIGFNPLDGSFSKEVDTLINTSKDSLTSSFPRPSYDGKYLLYTRFNYGQFAIWHKEADLWILNLETKENYPLTNANSSYADSYHSWSQNSEWIVFESRRDDGFYTRAYIAYIDKNGKAAKAFLLPQQSPEYNRKLMYSFNVPEFATKEFVFDKGVLESKLKSDTKLQFE